MAFRSRRTLNRIVMEDMMELFMPDEEQPVGASNCFAGKLNHSFQSESPSITVILLAEYSAEVAFMDDRIIIKSAESDNCRAFSSTCL